MSFLGGKYTSDSIHTKYIRLKLNCQNSSERYFELLWEKVGWTYTKKLGMRTHIVKR